MRLNALAILCADKSQLSYADIASKLGVDEESVEFWVIDGEFVVVGERGRGREKCSSREHFRLFVEDAEEITSSLS